MEPVTAIVIVVVASLGVGFGAGWGLKPDASVKALEAQTEAIKELQAGQATMLEHASKPIVIDAELKRRSRRCPCSAARTWVATRTRPCACGPPASSSGRAARSDRSAVR